MSLVQWDWVARHGGEIGAQLGQHVLLTGLALGFGLLIAFPLALAAVRWPRFYGPSLGLTGILFTVPSLALFILLIPFTGLSIATSLIGLTIYTLLILFRNIVEGLRGVPADVSEAAKALGYSRGRRLVQVELPIALPVVAKTLPYAPRLHWLAIALLLIVVAMLALTVAGMAGLLPVSIVALVALGLFISFGTGGTFALVPLLFPTRPGVAAGFIGGLSCSGGIVYPLIFAGGASIHMGYAYTAIFLFIPFVLFFFWAARHERSPAEHGIGAFRPVSE